MQSKYKKIYDEYVAKIENGQLQPGDSLPSESQMMERHGASRDTVRKAMMLLEQRQYIIKQRGKESVVADREKMDFPVSRIVSFAELAERNHMDVITTVEDLCVITGDERIMKKMQVDEEEEIYRISRVRCISGRNSILDKDYVLKRMAGKLTRQICQGSLYEYLEKEQKLKIGLARKEITFRPASREDQMLLDLGETPYVAVVSSYVRLEDGTLFQYTESRHCADEFRFVEYAKRG